MSINSALLTCLVAVVNEEEVARKFINDETFLVGRHAILLIGWKGSPRAVNNTRIDSKDKFSYGLSNLTLESQGSVTHPW